MAKHQNRASFMNSPIMEKKEQEEHDDYEEATFSSSGCCCFKFFSKWPQPNNEAQSLLNQKQVPEQRETWLVTKLKEVKETSEIIAGPKWKNFVRKISGYVNNKRKRMNGQFQYSPQSYALNFDGGFDSDEDEYTYGKIPDFNSGFPSATTTTTVSQERHENGL